MSPPKTVLGIDIGGSGIKAAVVDVECGIFTSERFRIDTPQPSTPKNLAQAIVQIARYFEWQGLVGVGFPAIVRSGVAFSASNIHKKWIETNVEKLFSEQLHLPVVVVNDADAAGMAAMRFGAGKEQHGTVIFLTIGTGIGSSLFLNGQMVPGTEFGHLYLNGKIVEKQMSNAVRKRDNLSMETWGKRLNKYFNYLEKVLSPDLIIVGGGGGKHFAEFAPFLHLNYTKVIPSVLQNDAGIIGAALFAWDRAQQEGSDISG